MKKYTFESFSPQPTLLSPINREQLEVTRHLGYVDESSDLSEKLREIEEGMDPQDALLLRTLVERTFAGPIPGFVRPPANAATAGAPSTSYFSYFFGKRAGNVHTGAGPSAAAAATGDDPLSPTRSGPSVALPISFSAGTLGGPGGGGVGGHLWTKARETAVLAFLAEKGAGQRALDMEDVESVLQILDRVQHTGALRSILKLRSRAVVHVARVGLQLFESECDEFSGALVRNVPILTLAMTRIETTVAASPTATDLSLQIEDVAVFAVTDNHAAHAAAAAAAAAAREDSAADAAGGALAPDSPASLFSFTRTGGRETQSPPPRGHEAGPPLLTRPLIFRWNNALPADPDSAGHWASGAGQAPAALPPAVSVTLHLNVPEFPGGAADGGDGHLDRDSSRGSLLAGGSSRFSSDSREPSSRSVSRPSTPHVPRRSSGRVIPPFPQQQTQQTQSQQHASSAPLPAMVCKVHVSPLQCAVDLGWLGPWAEKLARFGAGTLPGPKSQAELLFDSINALPGPIVRFLLKAERLIPDAASSSAAPAPLAPPPQIAVTIEDLRAVVGKELCVRQMLGKGPILPVWVDGPGEAGETDDIHVPPESSVPRPVLVVRTGSITVRPEPAVPRSTAVATLKLLQKQLRFRVRLFMSFSLSSSLVAAECASCVPDLFSVS